MPQKHLRYAVYGGFRSAYPCAFCFGVRHSRAYTLPYYAQLQFSENARHLNKSVSHWIDFSRSTININTADNIKVEFFLFDSINNITELFCASG